MGIGSGTAARNVGINNAMQAMLAEQRAAEQIGQAKSDALGAIGQGRTDSLAALGQGYSQAAPEYQGAIDRFNPWVDAGKGALTTYQNSLGQNGAAGNAAAVAQFQASPGYQYQVDQATDGVARKASALGALGSGNTMQAISDRAGQMANAEYGGWQDRLNGLSNTGLQATGQQAGLQQGLGNLYAQQGRDTANIYTGAGTAQAGVHTGLANLGLNNIWQSQGLQSSSLANGQKQATDNVNTGVNFGINAAGSVAKLFSMGMM
jgi:hypothetical protein